MPQPTDPIKPEEFRAMAESLHEIQRAMVKVKQSGLNESALVALLKDRTGMTKGAIITILHNLYAIGDNFLTAEYRKQIRENK